jgi:hypothetical protein
MKLSDFFVVLCASHSSMIEFNTAFNLADVVRILDKHKISACSDKAGISVARTHLLEKVIRATEKNGIENDGFVKALWIDSDIRTVSPPQKIARDIMEADRNGWNLVANYPGMWENNTYINTLAKPGQNGAYNFYMDDELDGMKNLEELPVGTVGGMGFAYISIPIDYRFEFTKYGEDICMFRHMYEHYPDYRLRYWDVELEHLKTMPLRRIRKEKKSNEA